jgi:hypothetical protein
MSAIKSVPGSPSHEVYTIQGHPLGNSVPIVLGGNGLNFVGYHARVNKVLEASFTRPADAVAYAIGDIIANSTTAASVVFPQWSNYDRKGTAVYPSSITGAYIRMTVAGGLASDFVTTLPTLNLDIFCGTPPVPVVGDNGGYQAAFAGKAIHTQWRNRLTMTHSASGITTSPGVAEWRASALTIDTGLDPTTILWCALYCPIAVTLPSAAVFTIGLELEQF